MKTSNIFKAAHKLTKATVQTDDSYSATFAICLKVIYAESAQYSIIERLNTNILINKKPIAVTLYGDESGFYIKTANKGKFFISGLYRDNGVWVGRLLDKNKAERQQVVANFTLESNEELINAMCNCYSSNHTRQLKVFKKDAICGSSAKDGAMFELKNKDMQMACYTYA